MTNTDWEPGDRALVVLRKPHDEYEDIPGERVWEAEHDAAAKAGVTFVAHRSGVTMLRGRDVPFYDLYEYNVRDSRVQLSFVLAHWLAPSPEKWKCRICGSPSDSNSDTCYACYQAADIFDGVD